MKKLLIITILMLMLVGCGDAPPPTLATDPLRVAYTPDLEPMREQFLACSEEIGKPMVLNVSQDDHLVNSAILVKWGEPEPLPDFVYPVGEERLVVIVHLSNPVTELTLTQIRAIFEGEITNWAEVGGEDAEIVVWTMQEGNDSQAIFQDFVISGGSVTPGAFLAPRPDVMHDEVFESPKAIGYLPASYLNGFVTEIETGITQPLLGFALQEPSEAAVAWLGCMQAP